MNFSLLLLLLFILATAAQLVLWWGVFGRLALPRGNDDGSANAILPPCSVIISARNEAGNLRAFLPTILEQQYPDFEVIVVNDASSDDTAGVLLELASHYPSLLRTIHLAEKEGPGKKQALTRGIEAALHGILVLTDADCRPASPHWLREMTRPFERPETEIVLGYGPFTSKNTLLNRWACYETTCTAVQYLSMALAGMPYMGVGRNLAWRKPLFRQAGGFAAHAQLASGDDDLLVNAVARAGNTEICLRPEAFVFSEAKQSLSAWLRQKRRHLSAGWHYRREHQVVLGAAALTHGLHYGLALLLFLTGFGIKYVLWGCILRESTVWLLSARILRRLGERRLIPWVIPFDAMMAGYYALVTGPALLLRPKDNPWK
ncbi:MAG TPA: glycosyltransferase [Saprospiraceae bacterium]|nr:glycosyltransferase [Saprospiraceae bacterium]